MSQRNQYRRRRKSQQTSHSAQSRPRSPEEALAHLNVEEGDSLTMTEGPEGTVRLSPHKAEVARQMAVARDVMKVRYRQALRELAK